MYDKKLLQKLGKKYERKAAKALMKYQETGSEKHDREAEEAEIIVAALRAMMDNADVAPVVRSEWIWCEEDKYQCANCENRTRVDEAMNKPLYSFCPYCGAKKWIRQGRGRHGRG